MVLESTANSGRIKFKLTFIIGFEVIQCQTRIVFNNALRIQSITSKIYLKIRNNTVVVYSY